MFLLHCGQNENCAGVLDAGNGLDHVQQMLQALGVVGHDPQHKVEVTGDVMAGQNLPVLLDKGVEPVDF